jgi:Protein of unknown function (DUF2783)
MTLPWPDGDEIFERLTEVTAGMDDGQLAAFLARLVFLLADAVDDGDAVLAAVDAAAPTER